MISSSLDANLTNSLFSLLSSEEEESLFPQFREVDAG